MSILATATQPTQPASEDVVAALMVWGVIALLALGGLIVAYRVRAYRPSKVLGPDRLPPSRAAWPLALALFIAVFTLFVASGTAVAAFGATQETLNDSNNPKTVAISIIGTLAAFVVSIGVLTLIGRESLVAIGFQRRTMAMGIGFGALGALFGIPWTFIVGQVVDFVYQAVNYVHPREHDLLRTMRETSAFTRYAAIAAAVVVAPVVEEFLFRGLLQTMIRAVLNRVREKFVGPPTLIAGMTAADAGILPPPAPMPVMPIDHVPEGPVAAIPPPYAFPIAPPSSPAVAWLSIVLTSLLFGLVHPLWTAPIIFFLSLVIGYVYERTGNIWSAITVHVLFNLTSTLLYLATM